MGLDASAREANVRDSLKKYWVDNLWKTHKTYITFDITLSTPKLQGHVVDSWVAINIGSMDRETLSSLILEMYCCTRKDPEGFKLAQLSDRVMNYLSDTTKTDGMKRITLYQSKADEAWTEIGALLVQDVIESGQLMAMDNTKYKILTCTLRWASKI